LPARQKRLQAIGYRFAPRKGVQSRDWSFYCDSMRTDPGSLFGPPTGH
jgi:hypothetical protein